MRVMKRLGSPKDGIYCLSSTLALLYVKQQACYYVTNWPVGATRQYRRRIRQGGVVMNPSRRRAIYLALILVFALLLTACERPLSRGEEETAAEATETAVAAEETEAGGADSTSDEASEEPAAGEAPSGEESDSGGMDEDTSQDAAEDTVTPETGEESASQDEGGDADSGDEAGEQGASEEGSGDASAAEADEESATQDESEEETAADEEVESATPDSSQADAETGGESATETEDMGEAEVEDEAPAASEATSEDTQAEQPGGEDTASAAAETIPATHTVAAGENLYRIGLKYGMSWVTLARYNNLPNADSIYVGQVLRIPGGQDPATPSPPSTGVYVVKPGDNLYRIGLAFGVSWVEIAEANGIVNPNQIYPGQELKIPSSAPGPAPEFTHLVKPGQTLFSISLQYGVPWTSIAEANNISSPYVIYSGQTLIIPGG